MPVIGHALLSELARVWCTTSSPRPREGKVVQASPHILVAFLETLKEQTSDRSQTQPASHPCHIFSYIVSIRQPPILASL